MKIVYCISTILGSGGMQRVLSIKANYLADVLGHDVTIVTTDNGKGNPLFHFSSKIKYIDLGIAYVGYNFIDKLVNRLTQRIKLKKKLYATLNDLKPDIAISMFQNDASFLPSAKDGSIKVIESHSCRYYRLLRNENFINRCVSRARFYNDGRIIKRYDAFVTLTDEDKRDWSDSDNIHVIPDPMTIKCDEKADFSGKRVIAAGRFSYEKGYDNLVRAWALVERRHPDWELLIIGSQDNTAYVDYIKNIIAELGLKRVILRPSTKAIEEEYLKSNMLVMTSNFEGFGLVLTEAMSVGLPLVAFDCKCGPSDIIRDGENGFLVKDKNIEIFADRVCRLIEDPDLHARMSTKAIELSKLYNPDNIMVQWVSLFDELMKSNKKS